MITHTRLLSQQLAKPSFDSAKELVSWMGAVQAQDYTMVKWAVGMRLKSPSLKKIDEAIEKGEVMRIHVMRPTWHLVTVEDIRWMSKLSKDRLLKAYSGYDKLLEVTPEIYAKTVDFIAKLLEGHNYLTKVELEQRLKAEGISTENNRINRFLIGAEAEGIICNGTDKNGKPTFALFDERVPASKTIEKEEALAKLALHYFRSHSPASLQDFMWWSGLSMREAKAAIGSLENQIVKDKYKSEELFVHELWQMKNKSTNVFHFLPPYDEYLISYKDRLHVLDLEHRAKAHTNNGLFYPVILYKGKIIGNWKKSKSKNGINIKATFFDPDFIPDENVMKKAETVFNRFLAG